MRVNAVKVEGRGIGSVLCNYSVLAVLRLLEGTSVWTSQFSLTSFRQRIPGPAVVNTFVHLLPLPAGQTA